MLNQLINFWGNLTVVFVVVFCIFAPLGFWKLLEIVHYYCN